MCLLGSKQALFQTQCGSLLEKLTLVSPDPESTNCFSSLALLASIVNKFTVPALENPYFHLSSGMGLSFLSRAS